MRSLTALIEPENFKIASSFHGSTSEALNTSSVTIPDFMLSLKSFREHKTDYKRSCIRNNLDDSLYEVGTEEYATFNENSPSKNISKVNFQLEKYASQRETTASSDKSDCSPEKNTHLDCSLFGDGSDLEEYQKNCKENKIDGRHSRRRVSLYVEPYKTQTKFSKPRRGLSTCDFSKKYLTKIESELSDPSDLISSESIPESCCNLPKHSKTPFSRNTDFSTAVEFAKKASSLATIELDREISSLKARFCVLTEQMRQLDCENSHLTQELNEVLLSKLSA
ncbi:unnamed protein product [Moneuplotes crassus]|uniref:Uncharacterized protein n=1 Tax=Euplotes crassus TaxID=5936 RepID=A0AAD1XLK1_EUPCR|nr:unnamed protein product [Moneuplotes crassus]